MLILFILLYTIHIYMLYIILFLDFGNHSISAGVENPLLSQFLLRYI